MIFRSGLRGDARSTKPHPGDLAPDYVRAVARAKADHGICALAERRLPMRPILAADTTLEFAGEIIGKPLDEADAAAILRRLSGRTHRV